MWQFLLGISQENCMFPNPEKKSVKKLRKWDYNSPERIKVESKSTKY
jgi:hypothetical protein